MFDIFVDADSLPRLLRPIVLRAGTRAGGKLVFVADRALPDVVAFINQDSAVDMVVVAQGDNSADDRLVELAGEGALCITHDIPLAARLLEKGCTVIDDRGCEYTDANIKSLLTGREVNGILREAGIFAQQHARHDKKTAKAFADNLDRVITRMLGKSNG